jgi:hypothetical protein
MPCFAPKFFEVAKRIIEMTNDCVLVVADLIADDCTEFRRLGYDFNQQTLCTVELSKKITAGTALSQFEISSRLRYSNG